MSKKHTRRNHRHSGTYYNPKARRHKTPLEVTWELVYLGIIEIIALSTLQAMCQQSRFLARITGHQVHDESPVMPASMTGH